MRRGQRRMHANVRALPVPGHTAGAGDADRSRLRASGERVRVQAEGFEGRRSRTSVHHPGNATSVVRFRERRRKTTVHQQTSSCNNYNHSNHNNNNNITIYIMLFKKNYTSLLLYY